MVRRWRDEPHAGRGVPHLGDDLIHLVAGQLTALTGLGALRHLDLHHAGVDEILRRHPEATRRHLLDGRAHGIAVGQRLEAVRLLAALARIGLAADAVHGDSERGVGLARDRSEAHGAGGEALDDSRGGLDLLQRHRLALELLRGPDAEQAAQGHQLLGLVVDLPCVGAVLVRQVAAHRVLQVCDHARAPHVRLAAHAVGVLATHVQVVLQRRHVAEGQAMALGRLARDLAQPNAFNLGVGAGEVLLHEGRLEADGVEDLGAAVGLVGGDAHLGHHLQQPLIDRLDIALLRLLQRQLLVELRQQLLQRLEGEIGVDGLRTVAGEHAELVHLVRLPGLHDEAHPGAQALADQVMVHGRGGQQRRDGNAVRARRPVGQDDDVVLARAHRLLGLRAHHVERGEHAGGTLLGRVGDVDRHRGELVVLDEADAADALQVLVGQDRLVDLQPLQLGGAFQVEQVRPRPNERDQAHHQLLADRVDGRVRDLGEVLLEVGVQQLGLRGEHRHRRVVAHRAHRLLAGVGHRRHQELQALLGVAEHLLQIEQGHVGALARAVLLGQRQVAHLDLGALQPMLVGVARGQIGLQVVVVDDAALLHVDEQHLAGLQAPLAGDVLLRHRQHAGLGRHDHPVVLGDEIARRPQAVAIQRGADLAAVGEGHGGGAVPRLHQAGVILVEGAPLGIHQRVAGPRLGDQHHGGMGEAVAAHHQELERVVEAGRVRLALVGDGPKLGNVAAEQRGRDGGLPGRHPVDVAAQRVDLAVVGDHAVGVRQLPRGEGVGGEALVHQCHRRGEPRVGQVLVVLGHLVGQEHALVDQRAARQRHRVVADVAVLVGIVERVGDDLADQVEPALELLAVSHALGAADEDLPVHRLHGLHHLRQAGVVHRHRAPAQELQALLADDAHPHALAMGAQALVLRHERVADGVVAGLGQLDLELGALLGQEVVRDLDQDAGAVARDRVGAHRAPVLDVAQDGDRVLDERVGLAALEIGDEADATGIVLPLRIEEPLGAREERHSSGLLRSHDNLQHRDAGLRTPSVPSSVLHSSLHSAHPARHPPPARGQ